MSKTFKVVIPKRWEAVKLGKHLRLINGRAYAREELLDKGTPVLRIQNLNGGDRWYYSDLDLPENKYCERGDLLFAWSASFGPYLWEGSRSIYHYHIWKVIPDEKVDKKFAFHLLNWITQAAKDAAHGIAMMHITKEGMENSLIPLPPFHEQKRLAAILDKADELRQKRRITLARLDDLLQSVFFDMFGDPVTNPKGWKMVELEKLGKITTGNTPSRKINEYYGSHIEWIKSDNLNTPYHYLTQAVEYLSELGERVGRTTPANSILVTCIAGSPDSIGNAAIANRKVAFNQQINSFFPNKPENVFFFYFQFLVGKRLVQRASTNSMKGMVSKSAFSSVQFPCPPEKLQSEFSVRAKKIVELIEKNYSALAKAEFLFLSLQQRAFRGEL